MNVSTSRACHDCRRREQFYDSWFVASRSCKRDNDALLDYTCSPPRPNCSHPAFVQVHERHSTVPYRNGHYEDINTSCKIPLYHGVPCFSGCSGVVVEYRTRNREVAGSTHTRSTASNFEQVLCAQANSASYPQWDGKWVVATATGWRPSVADWGDGVSANCTVSPVIC